MVISTVNQVVYNGDGITTAWPYTFRIIDATDIKLTIIDADGTATDVTADYFVDTVNNTVYYPGYAPGAEPPQEDQPPKLQEGQKLVVYRELPITQEKDLGEKWPFYVIELALDKLTMILQQVFDWWGRALKVSQGKDITGDVDLTVPMVPGTVITVNDDGTGFEAREALMEVDGVWDGEGITIKNIGEPDALQDAATKNYVDMIVATVVAEGGNIAIFNNVAAVRAADVSSGMTVATKGFSLVNDGGASVYTIRAKTMDDVDDGEFIIVLDNGNVAERIMPLTESNPMLIDKAPNVYDDANVFTLATFNVQGMNYWRYPPNPPCTTHEALVAITRSIQIANPDIIGLNEACISTKYNSVGNALFSTGYPYSHFLGDYMSGGFQNANLGDALFSRYQFESVEDTTWADKRYLIHATFKINNKTVSVYCTHLSLVPADLHTQVTDILSALSVDTNPYKLVIGDLNLTYQGTEYQRFIDAGLMNTNGDKPTLDQSIIDYIFRTPNIDVVTYDTIVDANASDHNMLWAKLKLM